MNTDNSTVAFNSLLALCLITPAQHRAALAHPQRKEIPADAGLAAHLLWLVDKRLVSHAKLGGAGFPDDASARMQEEHSIVLTDALLAMERRIAPMNAQLYDRLLHLRLIGPGERQAALGRTALYAHASEGEALAELVHEGVVPRAKFDKLRHSVGAKRHQPDGRKREAIVNKAQGCLEQLDRKAALRPQDKSGGSFIWPLIPIGALCFVLYERYTAPIPPPAPAPAAQLAPPAPSPTWESPCDTLATLRSLFDQVGALPIGGQHGVSSFETTPIGNVRHLGDAPAQRQRACVATIGGEDRVEVGYVVAQGTQPGTVTLTLAPPRVLQARFGQVQENGDFKYNAEPIGRAEVKAALRAGLDALRAGFPRDDRDKLGKLFGHRMPERQHEIAEAEPIGPCRKVRRAQVCPLLIEYDDTLRQLVGWQPVFFEAEFAFVRKGKDQPWTVANDFSARYEAAARQHLPPVTVRMLKDHFDKEWALTRQLWEQRKRSIQ